ncbi:Caltractin [Nymphaea thermarum]|nr:Caltractin [Nymphaea thermarum]
MCPSERYPLSVAAGKPDLRDAFVVLDADGDGRIGPEDLRAAGFVDEEEIGTMISVADANKNGFVELEEFEQVLGPARAGEAAGRRVMDEAFRMMDRDGDGVVGFSDLRAYMSWAGVPASDKEIRAMLRMGGGDGTKGVSCDDLVRILTVGLDRGPFGLGGAF